MKATSLSEPRGWLAGHFLEIIVQCIVSSKVNPLVGFLHFFRHPNLRTIRNLKIHPWRTRAFNWRSMWWRLKVYIMAWN